MTNAILPNQTICAIMAHGSYPMSRWHCAPIAYMLESKARNYAEIEIICAGIALCE